MTNIELKNYNEEPIKISYLIEILIRQKWIILSVLFAVLLITAIYTLTQKRMYESSASIMIEDNQANQTLGISTAESNDRQIQNQMEVLQSKDLIRKVADNIEARVYLNDEDNDKSDTLWIYKQAVKNVREAKDPNVTIIGEIMTEFTKNMFVTTKEGTNVIKFSYRNPDPQEAALLANMYCQTYTENDLEMSRANATALRNFLEEQNKIKTEKLARSDSALQAYMQTAKITQLDAETNNLTNRVATLESELEANEIDYKNTKITLDKYKEELQKLAPNITQKLINVDDQYIQQLQEVLAKTEADRDMLKINSNIAGVKGQYSGQVQVLNNRIDSLKSALKDRSNNYVQSSLSNYSMVDPGSDKNQLSELAGEIQKLDTKLSGLDMSKNILYDNLLKYESKMGGIPRQSITLAKLQRDRLFNEKLYLSIGEKYEEALLAEKSSFGKVSILDEAGAPLLPISPDFKFNFLVGILSGLSLGVFLAFVLHFMYNKINTPRDIEQLGYKLISIIPKMKLEAGNTRKLLSGTGSNNGNGSIIVAKNPNSEIYESYLRLGINLAYNFQDRNLNSLLITSPGPGAGKSATALNVSVTLANLGKSVLLVDTDLRRPVIHKYFNKQITPGLTEYLMNQKSISDIIQHTLVKGLDVITCGARLLNPSLILSTPAMKKFMTEETKDYDFIIYDAPPLNVVTDSLHLAKNVDEVIMVVRAEKTNINEFKHANDMLGQVNVQISGIVLNDFDSAKTPFSYGKYYGYYGYSDEESNKKKIFRRKKKGIAA